MARLTLKYSGGQWNLIVPNTSQAVALKLGEQGAAENAAVRNLAQAMKKGADQVVADSEYIFENSSQVDIEVVKDIFSPANELVLEEELIFTATDGANLFVEIAEAGAELLSRLV